MHNIEDVSADLMRDRARAAFVQAFGVEPAHIGRAPGRVNLIGEHVDYNGGRCLPIALTHATWAAVGVGVPGILRATTSGQPVLERDFAQPGDGTWSDYIAGVLWAAGAEDGLNVAIESTVPIGAGLSSSAALECSVGVALGLSGSELIQTGMRAESEYVGAPTGGLDQTVAVLGTSGHALMLDFATNTHAQVPFAPHEVGLELLVIDTRVKHRLADGDGGYAQRRRQCDQAAAELGVEHLALATSMSGLSPTLERRTRHVVSETARVWQAVTALREARWSDFGALMTASHHSLRDDFEVSSPELDAVVETALEAGAIGARMTGGGFGGSAITLVPSALVDDVIGAVETRFATSGWLEPTYLLAQAGPGANC